MYNKARHGGPHEGAVPVQGNCPHSAAFRAGEGRGNGAAVMEWKAALSWDRTGRMRIHPATHAQ